MQKRIFDLTAVIFGLLLIWPVLLFIALLVLLVDGTPVLFRQKRIGKGGKEFVILKFRTMRPSTGLKLTVGSDARITRLGGILRKFKLDELPQLWNVVRGDMSLVGPRPEVEEYVRLYSPSQRQVLELVPGITDPASLKYYAESELLEKAPDPQAYYVGTIMPDKIEINLAYASRASVANDLILILRTIFRAVNPSRG